MKRCLLDAKGDFIHVMSTGSLAQASHNLASHHLQVKLGSITQQSLFIEIGCPGGTRTPNSPVNSGVLYH